MRKSAPLIVAEKNGRKYIDWNAMPISELISLNMDGISFEIGDGRIIGTIG